MSSPVSGRSIDRRIMPDGVHPNAAGMDSLGLCLDPTVAYLEGNPDAGEAEHFEDEVRDACKGIAPEPSLDRKWAAPLVGRVNI